jgi:hypothetical protein
MAAEYSYTRVANNYFCLYCNLVSLAWILLVKSESLHLKALGIHRRQVPAILKSIILRRMHLRQDSADTLTLPAFGHLCMRVHRGYKVFDFKRMTVTKLFDDDYNETAAALEIGAVRDAAALDFAPSLLDVGPQDRWYTETFFPGTRSPKTGQSKPVSLFEQVIAGYLSQMIRSKPLRTTRLAEYFHEVHESLTRQLTSLQLDADISTRIVEFTQRIAERLENTEDTDIYLAFTHGDFSFVNFQDNNGRIAVIDWESAQHRSALHDLYNYYFTELYYGRPQSDLLTEIDTSVQSLSQRLAADDPALSRNVAKHGDAYRWLYYLERLQMLLEREMSEGQLKVIRHSADTFDWHELSLYDQ